MGPAENWSVVVIVEFGETARVVLKGVTAIGPDVKTDMLTVPDRLSTLVIEIVELLLAP